MNFEEYCQTFANLSFSERVGIGQENFSRLYEELSGSGNDDEHIFTLIHALVTIGVSADRSADTEEYLLYNAIFRASLTPEEFYNVTNGGSNEELIDAVDAIVDSLSPEAKMAAVNLVAVFLSADDAIVPSEVHLLAKLLDGGAEEA